MLFRFCMPPKISAAAAFDLKWTLFQSNLEPFWKLELVQLNRATQVAPVKDTRLAFDWPQWAKTIFFKKLANFMVQASPLSVLYTIHYTKRHSVCLGPDSKDRGVDLRAVVLIANMPRSIGCRERGGGGIWLLNTGVKRIWNMTQSTAHSHSGALSLTGEYSKKLKRRVMKKSIMSASSFFDD